MNAKTISLLLLTGLPICFSLDILLNRKTVAVIEGRIFNAANNEPIPFAGIVIYGTTHRFRQRP